MPDEDQPQATALMGEAEAKNIEPGGTDNSMDSTTNLDESVHVNIEAPPSPEPVGVPEHSHPEPEHKHITDCPECLAAVAEEIALRAEMVEEEHAVADPPTETVIEEPASEGGDGETIATSSSGHMAPGWF